VKMSPQLRSESTTLVCKRAIEFISQQTHVHTHTHTHPFNGPFSGTTQKGKTNLDFTEGKDSEWLWHQLGDMQVCISFQTDNHASTPPLKFFTGRMPFLPPNNSVKALKAPFAYPHSTINFDHLVN